MPTNVRHCLPPTEQLLVDGGDARIALDPAGLNKYGYPPFPDPGLVALGSSTASDISAAGFAAADRFRDRLLQAVGTESDAAIYARELSRIRQELVRLCGLSDLPGLEVIFAASGTDLHLVAAQIGSGAEPRLAIMVDAAETGSGVPAALAGCHFSSRAALGDAVSEGESIVGGGSASSGSIEVVTVPVRHADGTPRQVAEVDAEFESRVTKAAAAGQRVLLMLADVSKTGMIAPSPACVLALHRRLPESVDVFVDACQFRIAPSTLRAYLEHGFMVALTGSKFVTGPPFSGALFIPPEVASRLRVRPLPRTLTAYSTKADWPENWNSAELLDKATNFGLLLRWEAALAELRAFRSVPEAEVANFLQEFAHAIRNRLKGDHVFEPLPVPELDRYPLAAATGWDHIQTIFPFLLFHPETRRPLSREETMRIYRLLQLDLTKHHGLDPASAIAALRCQLGQPVACGTRDGVPVSALRICASARLVVEATAQSGKGAAAVIDDALAALNKTAWLIQGHL